MPPFRGREGDVNGNLLRPGQRTEEQVLKQRAEAIRRLAPQTLEEAIAQLSRKAAKVLDDNRAANWSCRDAMAARMVASELRQCWDLIANRERDPSGVKGGL